MTWMRSLLAGCFVLGATAGVEAAERPPNVLMIVVDDLNDWVGGLGGHPQAKTPHIDRLARRGTLFANAHCQAPICAPSRNSVLSGKRPSTTGCYDLSQRYASSESLVGVESLPAWFAKHGYLTLGGGKVFHGRGDHRFDVELAGRGGPRPPKRMNWERAVWDWGPFPETDAEMGDDKLARQAARELQQDRDRPFFMAVGFFRPHVPLHVPPKWFAKHPLDSFELPAAPPEDLDDLPRAALEQPNGVAPRHRQMLKGGRWRSIVQAYLASISFADACIGKVLDGLDAGPHRGNTIVVLWSDHGFHLGEKQHWAKRTLWEESTRVPLIFAGPGVEAGAVCRRPVGLIDVYPTLLETCGLPKRDGLEGASLTALLEDADAARKRPAITTFRRGNHAIRSEHWRYIRYADGSEELYDHRKDPGELRNLASDAKYADVIREHAAWLPETNAPPAGKVQKGKPTPFPRNSTIERNRRVFARFTKQRRDVKVSFRQPRRRKAGK